MQGLARRLYGWTDTASRYAWFLAPLLTRLLVGYTFWFSGFGKVHNPDVHANLVEMLRHNNLPSPEVTATTLGYLEWLGAVLLVAGFLTRPTALILAVSMGVALATTERDDFVAAWTASTDKGPVDVTSFVLLCGLLWLVMFGAGALSLDRLFGKVLRPWSGADDDSRG